MFYCGKREKWEQLFTPMDAGLDQFAWLLPLRQFQERLFVQILLELVPVSFPLIRVMRSESFRDSPTLVLHLD